MFFDICSGSKELIPGDLGRHTLNYKIAFNSLYFGLGCAFAKIFRQSTLCMPQNFCFGSPSNQNKIVRKAFSNSMFWAVIGAGF